MITPPQRILVVDDDPDVRRITCLMLRQGGYHPVEAGSGPEALERLANPADRFSLLVTDLHMPHMDGEELARRALAARPGLKVVFVTGLSSEALAAAVGPDRFSVVEKPYTPDQLLARVKEALGG